MSDILLVPIFYIKVYQFRKKQNEKDLGLAKASVMMRKRRNLVSIKFNLFTWLWETCSIAIAALGPEFQLFYLLSISCGPPLLYFIGIEDNRRAAETYIRSNIRIFKKICQNKTDQNDGENNSVHIQTWPLCSLTHKSYDCSL